MSTVNPALAASAAADETPAILKAFRAARNAVKEQHPYERNTTVLKPHAVAWGRYAKQVGRNAVFYVPAAIVFLGWPFAVKWAINYSNGVYDTKPTKRSRA